MRRLQCAWTPCPEISVVWTHSLELLVGVTDQDFEMRDEVVIWNNSWPRVCDLAFLSYVFCLGQLSLRGLVQALRRCMWGSVLIEWCRLKQPRNGHQPNCYGLLNESIGGMTDSFLLVCQLVIAAYVPRASIRLSRRASFSLHSGRSDTGTEQDLPS